MMLASDLISPIIPVVNRKDSTSRALNLMNELHLSQLPVVEEEIYLFLLDEAELLDWDAPEMLLDALEFSHNKPAIRKNAHFFEAIKLAADYKLSIVPVIDEEERYMGAITRENMMNTIAHFNGIHEAGGLLILQIEPHDLVLSEISRLAEAESIHIYGIYTYNDPVSSELCVLIKTDRQDLSSLVATLERFRYKVSFRFDEPAGNEDELKKNYDLLMHYINM